MSRSPGAKKYDKRKKLKKARLKKKLQCGKLASGSPKEKVVSNPESILTEPTEDDGKLRRSVVYLRNWRKHRAEWKFNKKIQIFILKNWLSNESLKDKYFDWFCEYCKGLPSTKKESLSTEAVKLMESASVPAIIQTRARQLVQSL